MSNLKYFRDLYKNPDYYGEKPSQDEQAEIDDYWKHKDINQKNIETETIEKFGPTAQRFYDSLKLIKEASLKPEYKDDIEENKIIESRKELIIDYAQKVLDDVKKYLSKISEIELEKKENYSNKDIYLKILTRSDEERKIFHNRLITDLKILIRLINVNFNLDLADDYRLSIESKMKDREHLTQEKLEELMKKRQYVKFPFKEGIFLDLKSMPSNSDLERDFIANWALNMYSDLTDLYQKVNKI